MPGVGNASRRPADTPFKQQKLKAWQPILTPKTVIPTFFVVGIVFIPLGAIILAASNSVKESAKVRYDNDCAMGEVCSVELEVSSDMDPPVYFYYELDNFYQNHRRYVKSRNDDQLRGQIVRSYGDLEECDPLRSVDDSTDSANFYNPCGLIAASQFNDSFVLRNPEGNPVEVSNKGIAWKSDRETKFKAPDEDPMQQPPLNHENWNYEDVEDEDFIVWMRTAGLPRFKKLKGIIREKVEKGTYTVDITNNYDVSAFDGSKSIMLSTTTWIGGKNDFLGWAYVVTGLICLILGAGFLIKQEVNPRDLGDTKYLVWNKG